jgi:hypothetical protein
MFNDWKQAWQQAVENFQREVHDGASGTGPSVRGMEREIVSAQGALTKLDEEIRRTASDMEAEREAEQVCLRRESLARTAADDETVRIAAEFAARHGQRAALLGRKLAVLREERELLAADVAKMKDIIATTEPHLQTGGERDGISPSSPDAARDRDFASLERQARERAAAERLEELKRRMQR